LKEFLKQRVAENKLKIEVKKEERVEGINSNRRVMSAYRRKGKMSQNEELGLASMPKSAKEVKELKDGDVLSDRDDLFSSGLQTPVFKGKVKSKKKKKVA
jgi:hypothetical protein